MKVFGSEYLNRMVTEAQDNNRKRQHHNIHESFDDPCQRLFNAIEPGSYIRPHRHASDPRDEMLIAVRGMMALVAFDDQGSVDKVVRFGVDRKNEGIAVGVEIPSTSWHTVIAFEPGSVLLEVKAGPFDPNQPKDLAPWAPEEGVLEAHDYLSNLIKEVSW